VRGCPADEDRRTDRAGAEEERLAVLLDDVPREAAVQELEGPIGDPAARPPVDPERPELGLHPSDPHAEEETPPREFLDRRHPLRRR
jgi:hypothetical protein